jgi:hypothetical protein
MERLEHFTIGYIWDVPHWHDIAMWICFLTYSKKQIPLPMRLFNSWLLLLLLLLVSTKIIHTENSSSVSYLPGSACKDLKLESALHTENRSPLSITWIDKRTYLFKFVILSAVSVPASQIKGPLLQAAKVRNRVARNGKRTRAKRNAHTHARTHAHLSFLSLFCLSLCASSVPPLPHWFRTSPSWEPHLVWNLNCFGTLNWSDVVFKLEQKQSGTSPYLGDLTWFETSSVFVPHPVWDLTWFGTLNLLGTSPGLGPQLGHLVQLTELLWLERLKKVKKHSIFLQNVKRQLIITYYPIPSFFFLLLY